MKYVIFILLLLIFDCKNYNVLESKRSEENCYGDSVCVDISYNETTDSLDYIVLKIKLTLRNVSKRSLSIDSTQKGTYIEIYDENNYLKYIWISPDNWGKDTVVNINIAPQDSLVYSDVWERTDYNNNPIQAGTYVITGKILSFRSQDINYYEP